MMRTDKGTFIQFLEMGGVLCLLGVWSGCSLSKVITSSGQGWSDHYALMKGTQATHPAMIDGDPQTAGKAEALISRIEACSPPMSIPRSAIKSEALVTLPQIQEIELYGPRP